MIWRTLPLLALCACAATSETAAREAARRAVGEAVGSRFPGLPVQAVADCVIDNATRNEIVQVALDSRDGRPGPATLEIVAQVVARPETLTCLGYEMVPLLLT